MPDTDTQDLDFTDAAWESLYDAVDSTQFMDRDAQLIYRSLLHGLNPRSFGDYLRRYIYRKAGLTAAFADVPIKEYQLIIRSAFEDNHTPPSFTPTSAKLSGLSKNWLTQQTVRRSVVFLLGFGLNMGVDDVNMFLTKALQEREINPKDPLEVICWYCYRSRFNFLKFEQLWQQYLAVPPDAQGQELIYSDHTVGLRQGMHSVRDDASLISYLSRLKADKTISAMSYAARACFDSLYSEARTLAARLYNAAQADRHRSAVQDYAERLSRNDRIFDYEKLRRIGKLQSARKILGPEDITESDIEQVICAAIPKDRHGNLSPGKASRLNGAFAGKRFSRQRIGSILSGHAEVTRFDLITLNFFIFSQKLDEFPDPKLRYSRFLESMDGILERCFLGGLYVQNPYECFVLMCLLSEDPLGTYADVWELSYGDGDDLVDV